MYHVPFTMYNFPNHTERNKKLYIVHGKLYMVRHDRGKNVYFLKDVKKYIKKLVV